MKKSDLRLGMVLETRSGIRYMLIDVSNKITDYILLGKTGFMRLKNYNDDLEEASRGDHSPNFDIVKIYEGASNGQIRFGLGMGSALSTDLLGELLWERPEEVKMTVSEIESKLGLKPGQLRIKSDQAN